MNLVNAARALLAGERTPLLLHNARAHGWGAEHYGSEAVREQFRADPHTPSDGARSVEVPGHLALFDDRVALVATIGEGGFTRLWRLGPGEPAAAEPRVDVAFDPDLHQTRGDLFWRAQDHPALPTRWHDAVRAAGRALVDAVPAEARAPYRARAFLLHAFGGDGAAAALFAVHRLGPDPVRTAGFVHAAALIGTGKSRVVWDLAGERAVASAGWRPRL